MSINFQEILKELEYRVEHGIIDLTKEEQVTKLAEILRENGVSDANEMAQKARVYFSYINEALPKMSAKPKKNPSNGAAAAGQKSPTAKPQSSDSLAAKEAHKLGLVSTGFGRWAKSKGGPTTHMTDQETGKLVPVGVADEPVGKKGGKTSGGDGEKASAGGKGGAAAEKPKPNISPVGFRNGAEKRAAADKKTSSSKEVDVNKGVAVVVPKSRYGTKGSKEVDQKKAANRLKYLPKSKITPQQAALNFKKAYPKAVTTKYQFPKNSDALLKAKLPPAGYEALKSLMQMSKQGDFEPPISIVTDQYGAGKISAQTNELAMQAVFCFPATPKGIAARNEFLNSLVQNADAIENAGGVPILDKSWIKEMGGAHDAFVTNMNTKFGAGKWDVTGMTWDVRAQQEALGIDYNSKGDSTDINAQIKVNGKIYNEEISCKKDWAIFLLNAGLGEPSNWYYTLGPQKEMRAEELQRLSDAKDSRFGKNEKAELQQLQKQALSKAPVSNKELQDAQMKSAETGCLSIREVPKGEVNSVLKDCMSRKKNDPYYMDKNEATLAKQVATYLSKTKTVDVNELANYVGGGSKNFKKAVMVYHKMMGAYQGGDKWLDSHKEITYGFITQAAKKMATDKNFQGMLLKKLQEAIPVKTMVEGVENMQIDSMYVTQKHMQQMFGTTNWDDVKEFLSIKVTNGVAALTYSAKGNNAKPLKIANIQMREKGVGYNGSISLECTPAKEFENSCKEIDARINKRK